MIKKIALIILSVILAGCSPVKIVIDTNYEGWIYIIDCKNGPNPTLVLCPNKDGIVYVKTETYNSQKAVKIIQGNRDITKEVKAYRGEYYLTSDKKIKHFKFYVPVSKAPNESETSIDYNGQLYIPMALLIKQGKIDTTLIW